MFCAINANYRKIKTHKLHILVSQIAISPRTFSSSFHFEIIEF